MDSVLKLLVGIADLIVIFVFVGYLVEKDKPPKKDHFSKTLFHLGGHPYIPTQTLVDLDIIDNKIYLIHEKTNYTEEIDPRNILRCEVKNKQEITYDVTIPRILLLGPLALADKKKNIKDDYYLYLSYTIKWVEANCLFRETSISPNIYEIQSQVTRLKIETAHV